MHGPAADAALGALDDSVVAVDTRGRITGWNPAAEHLFGWRQGEVLGRQWADAVPTRLYGMSLREALARVDCEGRLRTRACHRARGGVALEAYLTLTRLREPNGGFDGYLAVSRPMTDPDEAERLAEQFDRISLLGVLATGIAHDLNGPLTYLLGFLRLARAEAARHDDPTCTDVASWLADAQVGAERIQDVVAELSGVLRQDQTSPISVVSLDDALAEASRLVARSGTVPTLPVPARLWVVGSRSRVVHALLNVLANSVCAARALPDGRVDVSVRVTTDEVAVEVSDDGPGIDPPLRARLGHPGVSANGDGTGLGLFLARRLLTSVGGRLELRDAPPPGATFRLVFRRASPPSPEEPCTPPSTPHASFS